MKQPEQKLSHSLLRAVNNSRDRDDKLCILEKSLNHGPLAKERILKCQIFRKGQEENPLKLGRFVRTSVCACVYMCAPRKQNIHPGNGMN